MAVVCSTGTVGKERTIMGGGMRNGMKPAHFSMFAPLAMISAEGLGSGPSSPAP